MLVTSIAYSFELYPHYDEVGIAISEELELPSGHDSFVLNIVSSSQ
jgi:hypothetical protein